MKRGEKLPNEIRFPKHRDIFVKIKIKLTYQTKRNLQKRVIAWHCGDKRHSSSCKITDSVGGKKKRLFFFGNETRGNLITQKMTCKKESSCGTAAAKETTFRWILFWDISWHVSVSHRRTVQSRDPLMCTCMHVWVCAYPCPTATRPSPVIHLCVCVCMCVCIYVCASVSHRRTVQSRDPLMCTCMHVWVCVSVSHRRMPQSRNPLMCVCLYVCVCIYVCASVSHRCTVQSRDPLMCVWAWVCVCLCDLQYVCLCVCISHRRTLQSRDLWACMCVYVCVYVHIYLCVCVYVL